MQVEQEGRARPRRRDARDPSDRGGRGASTILVVVLAALTLIAWWWVDAGQPGPSWLTGAPAGLEIPEDGEVAADHLDDGTPVFVSHLDGEVTVLDARLPGSSREADGRAQPLVGYCPSSGSFEDPSQGSVFGRDGRWNGGPAPGSLAIHPHDLVDGRAVVTAAPAERDRPGRSTTTTRPPPTGPGCTDLPPAEASGQLLAHAPGNIVRLHRVDAHTWTWVDVRLEPDGDPAQPDDGATDVPTMRTCDDRDCVGTFTLPGWRHPSGPALARLDTEGELRLLLPAAPGVQRSSPTTSGA